MNKLISSMLCVLLLLPASAAMAGTPTDTVTKTVDGVLALLKDGSLNKHQRRDKMRALINNGFDFRAMSQRTLATNWKKATHEQQDRFVKLFAQLIQNSYVGKIEAYTNETVLMVAVAKRAGEGESGDRSRSWPGPCRRY